MTPGIAASRYPGPFRAISKPPAMPGVMTYIHQNPVKAGDSIDSWTSYNDYVTDTQLTDTSFILSLFDKEDKKAKQLFKELLLATSEEEGLFLNESTKRKTSDDSAIEVIKRIGKISVCSAIADLDKNERDRVLVRLKKEGLSVR